MTYLVCDLIIAAILLLFALWGRHRGLILSIFSLLALLVAIVGSFVVSNFLTPVVSEWVQPIVEKNVVSVVQSTLPEGIVDPAETDGLDIGALLEENGVELPAPVQAFLDQLNENEADGLAPLEDLTTQAIQKTAQAIVRAILFLLCFVLILILWHLLAHALDLVSKLPGLNALNKLVGFLFGAVRGCLFLFVAAWLLQWYPTAIYTVIPAESIEQTVLLNFFLTARPLEFLASL